MTENRDFVMAGGGPKIFEKKIFINIFVTLGTKTVQKNAKIWGFPATRDRVTPSLRYVFGSIGLHARSARSPQKEAKFCADFNEPLRKVLSIKEKKYSLFYFLRFPGHSGQFLRNEKLIFSNFSQ